MILVTGARGFVGTAVVSELVRRRIPHRPVTRTPGEGYFGIGDINQNTDWTEALKGVESIVHLAARAHVVKEAIAGQTSRFPFPDAGATINLARQAVQAGVKRFVFVSSIKVNGEATRLGRAFTADDRPNPQSPYAKSKYDTERGLFELSEQTGLEVAVIRPPLVYGPGVKANFATMMDWVNRGIPLPLGSVNNKRSFIFVGNLSDLIILTVTHRQAAGQIFLCSDGQDMSTTELLQHMARALGQPSRMMPVPAPLLTFAAAALGRREVTSRLTDSLQVDIGKTRDLLGWVPRVSVSEGLQQTARSVPRLDLALDPIARTA